MGYACKVKKPFRAHYHEPSRPEPSEAPCLILTFVRRAFGQMLWMTYLAGCCQAFHRILHFDVSKTRNPIWLTGVPHGGPLPVRHTQNKCLAQQSGHQMGRAPSLGFRKNKCLASRIPSAKGLQDLNDILNRG